MKYKIGIFGSAINESAETIKKAKELGIELAHEDVIVITGGCSGMPYIVALEAFQKGAEIWGFSPNTNEIDQREMYREDDIAIYKKLFYIPKNYKELFFATENDKNFSDLKSRQKYRNVISTANCDAGIIISGRWGTLNEFTNLFDMGKVIGVLTQTGGIADEIENLSKKINKQNGGKLVFSDKPEELVKKILHELSIISL